MGSPSGGDPFIKLTDVAPHGYAVNRATVRQKKTSRPVKFELTEQTRQCVPANPRDRLMVPFTFGFK